MITREKRNARRLERDEQAQEERCLYANSHASETLFTDGNKMGCGCSQPHHLKETTHNCDPWHRPLHVHFPL
jgi:hypothetical protein